MFSIFGTSTRRRVKAEGTFICPRENCIRRFERKVSKRYVTVFSVAIVPFKSYADYVLCTSCRDTYGLQVLDEDHVGEVEDLATRGMRHVVASMLMADGTIDERERVAALAVMAKFASKPYTAADLDADLANFNPHTLALRLSQLAPRLSPTGKASIVRSAVFLGYSDGRLEPSERQVAREIGAAMSMLYADIDAAIDTVSSEIAQRRAAHAPAGDSAMSRPS